MTDIPTLDGSVDNDLEPPLPPAAHDPFGPDSAAVDHALYGRRHDSPAWRARGRIAGGVAAAVLGVGGFFAVGALASHTKSVGAASTPGAPGGGFPGGGGAFGGGGPPGGGIFGTVKAINGSSLVVTAANGTTDTVATTSATVVTEAVTGSLADVKDGDHLLIIGSGTTTFAARSITDEGGGTSTLGGGPPGGRGTPPPAGGMTIVSGTVASIGTGSIAVTEPDGAKAVVTTSSSTAVTDLRPISLAALGLGQQVQVRGTASNGSTTATAIQEGGGFGPGGQGGQPGQLPPAA